MTLELGVWLLANSGGVPSTLNGGVVPPGKRLVTLSLDPLMGLVARGGKQRIAFTPAASSPAKTQRVKCTSGYLSSDPRRVAEPGQAHRGQQERDARHAG